MFYKTIANEYHRIFPVKPEKLNFVKKHLIPGSILDVGCSVGELAYLISQLGYKVTAIDMDSTQIEIAKKRYCNNPDLKFFNLNMLNSEKQFKLKSFSSIICFGNVLVHLTKDNVFDFLTQVYGLLDSGGVFIGQIVNFDKVLLTQKMNFPTIETENIKFLRSYKFDNKNKSILFSSTYIIKKSDEKITNSVTLYPLKSNEVKELLFKCGFSKVCFFGDFKEIPFTLDSPAIIFKAEKH
jgi:2-polyprenyl-3-methyl-5-hydroxy-6-metoxy-1,4-benzoquinol methylase